MNAHNIELYGVNFYDNTHLIPIANIPIKCPYSMKPEGIVIHNTANDANPHNEIAYMLRNTNYVSYHYAVGNNEVVQGIPEYLMSWNSGDTSSFGSMKCIAIEICYSKSGGISFDKAQHTTATLCAEIMRRYGWGCDTRRLYKHEDFQNKHCPHRTLDDYGWDYFTQLVVDEYNRINEEEEMKEQLNMLIDEVAELTARVGELEHELDCYNKAGVYENCAIKWAYNDGNIPSWAKATVNKLCSKGVLKGGDNGLELSRLMLRILVILDRAGVFGE